MGLYNYWLYIYGIELGPDECQRDDNRSAKGDITKTRLARWLYLQVTTQLLSFRQSNLWCFSLAATEVWWRNF